MNEKIFRKKSLERISSPEQLTDYIRVSNPSVWIVLSAIVVLLAGALIWSVFGAMPETVTVKGFVQDDVGICYVNKEMSETLKEGMKVQLGDSTGTVAEVSQVPISSAELKAKYNEDYLAESLTVGDWNYPVKINGLNVADGLYEMAITVKSNKPISFLLN